MSLKHPKWRVAKIEDLSAEVLDPLITDLWDISKIFSFHEFISDIQIVGTYATGHARAESDIDFNIAMDSWKNQCHAMFEFFVSQRVPFVSALGELSQKHEVILDFTMNSVDLLNYVCVYSTKEKKVYNRKPEEKGYYWGLKERKWLVRDIPKTPASIVEVYPLEEVEKWHQIYGDKFVCLRQS